MLTQEKPESKKRNDMLNSRLIGKRIKSARKLKGVTQEQLAERANCTHTHICNIENAKEGISFELLYRISLVLGQSLDYFLMDNIHSNPQTKIENSIAPKLSQCDAQMLTVVDGLLENLLTYREEAKKQIEKDLQEQGLK